ncbi:MAG: ribonuclease HII [Verrucomicrobiales bacterium]|jgi:ribonuclease HII|nr:ribonuclease HII [Verrucomicrobiales bacterium]
MSGLLTWNFELAARASGARLIAGIDEAGRGCLAGPVVAGACVFLAHEHWPAGLNDSKQLSRAQRQRLYAALTVSGELRWSVGVATAAEIDRVNILQATFLAMRRALDGLALTVDLALVDGSQAPPLPVSTRMIVKGDSRSPSIAAASILAKETRDRMLERTEQEFPGYGFAKHKGYGTASHLAALARLGPCQIHRRSFAPVRQCAGPAGRAA